MEGGEGSGEWIEMEDGKRGVRLRGDWMVGRGWRVLGKWRVERGWMGSGV